MSTGPSIQAASIVKGNQSQVELDASHSALFYLFQEVSKLTSPIHSSFLDTYQASKQLNTTSRTDPLVVCKEEQDAHSLFPVLLCDEMKKVKEESPSSNVTTFIEPHCDCNSPWKVLSLINLHCEKLLHQEDVAEMELKSFHSPLKQDDNIPASNPEGTHAPKQEKSPAVAQLQSSSCNVSSATSKPELWTVKKEEIGLSSTHQWRTKTPRKQPHPSRSPDIQDPDFQGVTFRMDTELDDSREQCRLLITSKYSKELYKHVRKPRLRTRKKKKSLKISSSDEENDLTGKVCASCCTRKTPMWRDAEDGTPLCNACGIRYKKYRVRCVNCWHIPRKEGNSNSSCLKCGNFVSGWPHTD
uniref:Zinc finger GATA like protein 1 n=1 Tax=Stegastes partitus TaxID=144197 RepID=A0A3B5A535_9TELE